MGKTEQELRSKLQAMMARDVVLCQTIQSMGGDLSAKRPITLMFIASGEEPAKKLAAALARNEMPVQSTEPSAAAGDSRWFVQCLMHASVAKITEKDSLATFILFADEYDCDYDGWSAPIVEGATGPSS